MKIHNPAEEQRKESRTALRDHTIMKEWWVEHICGADMAFKKHLAAMR